MMLKWVNQVCLKLIGKLGECLWTDVWITVAQRGTELAWCSGDKQYILSGPAADIGGFLFMTWHEHKTALFLWDGK